MFGFPFSIFCFPFSLFYFLFSIFPFPSYNARVQMDMLNIAVKDGKHPGQRVVCLRGNLSLQTVPSFLKIVREENAPAIIVDFTDVNILDSAGVGALIQTHVACTRTQRRMALTGLSQRIESVLEVTRVRNLFPIFDSVADAEAHIL